MGILREVLHFGKRVLLIYKHCGHRSFLEVTSFWRSCFFGFTCCWPWLSYYGINRSLPFWYCLPPTNVHTLVLTLGFYFCLCPHLCKWVPVCGLDLLILNPGGHMQPVFAESGEHCPGSSLCCFANLDCFYYQFNLPTHAPPGAVEGEERQDPPRFCSF